MSDWVFCNCCNEGCSAAMTDNIAEENGRFTALVPEKTFDNDDDTPDPDCDPIDCVVATISMSFSSMASESFFLDESSGSFPWLLFLTSGGGGTGTFARAGGKPTTFEVDTEVVDYVGPTDTTRKWYVPMEIRLQGGFVWNRKDSTPTYVDGISWGDFDEWTLTAGADPPTGGDPVEDQPRCLGMTITTMYPGYVWEEPVTGINVSFTAATTDSCCDVLDGETWCLQYMDGSATGPIDGWMLNGMWYRDRDDLDCDGLTIEAAVTLAFKFATGGSCYLASLRIDGLSGLEFTEWRWSCVAAHDVRTIDTTTADWVYFDSGAGDDYCLMDIDSIATGDCDDGNGGGGPDCSHFPDPGPPADCPFFHSKYFWDGADWNLVYSNCVSPLEDTGPPTDPPGVGEPCVAYLCCDLPPSCPTNWCAYRWNGSAWILASGCSGICPAANPTPPGPDDPWIQILCCLVGP